MKYFTRERYLGLQSLDEGAMDAADEEWECAVANYHAYLQSIRPDMSENVRQLLDGFFLHDARVLSMGQRGDRFVISLQLDVPPNDLLTITYELTGPPLVKNEPFSWVKDAECADWLYDEIELRTNGDKQQFVHSVLFSNGWELDLPFGGIQMLTAFPILPYPSGSPAVSASRPA